MPTTPPRDYSENYRKRWLEDDIDEFLESLSPEESTRRQIAGYVATSINAAHSLKPGLWGLTRLPEMIRLNFGKMEALVWSPAGLFLMAHLSSFEKEGTIAPVDAFIWHEYGPFQTVPGSRYIKMPSDDPELLASLFQLARPAHMWHLQLASRSSIGGQTKKSHHPGLIDAIAKLASTLLPQPNYVRLPRPIVRAADFK